MQGQLAGLLAHEHAPLSLAQAASGVTAPAPLFTTLFNYRHSPAPAGRGGQRAGGIEVLGGGERTNYPVTVAVDDTGTGFILTVQAVAPADAREVLALLQNAVAGLAGALESVAAIPLRRIGVLGEADRRRAVAGGGGADGGVAVEAPAAATVPGLVELRAARARTRSRWRRRRRA